MMALITWWLAIQLFGLAALPLTKRILAWLPDRGYAFSKVVGLLLVSYLVWLGAVAGILVNDAGGITFALLILAAISAWILWSGGWSAGWIRLRSFWRENRANILVVEILFILTLAGWTMVRAYTPDKILPAGGEKYMEIAFLNGVLNSPRFPPLDPWLAGFAISYYYFGYVMMGVMTLLTGVDPAVGFDLYDALLFALTAVSAYGIVYNMAVSAGKSGWSTRLAGLLGALFVGGLGNLQGLLEGLYSGQILPAAFWQWLDIPGLADSAQNGSFYPGHGWWWWRASRVIRDLDLFSQPVVFQPIDEFPFFSFLLGDNHPHKLALPFVLLCIGLAFNLLQKKASETAAVSERPVAPRGPGTKIEETSKDDLANKAAGDRANSFLRFWQDRAKIGLYAFYALALGSLGFLNTWDMPIYTGLVLLAYAAGKMYAGARPNLNLLLRTVILGAGLGAGAILLYLFFYLGFASQAGGVLPYIFQPTRLVQYLVMFGPFILILTVFLWLAAHRTGKRAFPWSAFGRTWFWTAGVTLGGYLLVLLLGLAFLSINGGQILSSLQPWLGSEPPLQLLGRILAARFANPWLFLLVSVLLALALTGLFRGSRPGIADSEEEREALAPATSFALLLALVGLGLTLVVEFFYLRDSFGMRMNTVFKFYFQGWVLMACASAYGLWWVASRTKAAGRALFLAAAVILISAGLVYPLMSVYSRTEGFSRKPIISAAATVAGLYPGHWAALPDDWAAIQWLQENTQTRDEQVPILLEAPGGGYETSGRISAFTGFPTLLGWINHEGQWRGGQEEINNRLPDIEIIYTTADYLQALNLLRKWKVDYLVVGEAERQYIQRTCSRPELNCSPSRALAKFDRFFSPVFSHQSITIYGVQTLP